MPFFQGEKVLRVHDKVNDVILYQFHDIARAVEWVRPDYRIVAGDETPARFP
jgi:hypothetical protein